MVIPSPGFMMPTMRSPGTAPPSAKRTAISPSSPRIGMAFSAFAGRSPEGRRDRPGTRNFMPEPRFRPNQPSSLFVLPRGCRERVFDIVRGKPRQDGLGKLVRIGPLRPLEGTLEDLAAEPGILLAH